MTAADSLFSLIESTRYVVRHDIPGAFVECGVWRGGSVMAIARTLLSLGVDDRELWLYDTFEGMSEPTDADAFLHSEDRAADLLERTPVGDGANIWCVSSLDEVRQAIESTGYPVERVHYIEGKVEDTLPDRHPGSIALLRLDTDWYESTLHEMRTLVPSMSDGAPLIIDDYWHWKGCRQAVDEYLAETGLRIHLTRVDITAVGVVPSI